jgi:hypothetical protein
MSLQRSPTRYASRRPPTPIRRAIRRRPSPRPDSAARLAVTAPGCSAAAWVRVPERRGGWPGGRVRSAQVAGSRHLRSHRSPRGGASSRRSAQVERPLDAMRP